MALTREFRTSSSEETIALGRELAAMLTPPKMLILHGDLGAGKTTLVKGIAAALGAADPEEVTSPTFTLIHEYVGQEYAGQEYAGQREGREVLLYHLDLYRLEEERELYPLGLEELETPQSLVLIEWGEKFPSLVARADGEIVIESIGPDARRVTLRLR
jgi:tRNA threonylcarbamoyladenosine biosynthesis protein TsaE